MNEIILIGPVGVGKTTTSKLLAKKLGLTIATMDDLRLDQDKEIGYNNEQRYELIEKSASRLFISIGIFLMLIQWQEFWLIINIVFSILEVIALYVSLVLNSQV